MTSGLRLNWPSEPLKKTSSSIFCYPCRIFPQTRCKKNSFLGWVIFTTHNLYYHEPFFGKEPETGTLPCIPANFFTAVLVLLDPHFVSTHRCISLVSGILLQVFAY
jgi:hypothetical protein